MFLEQFINGLTVGGIYALIAVGYTMVYGGIGLINFAHGEIYMLGAFVAWTLITVFGLPLYLAFALTILICAALGVLIDIIAYRPLRAAPRLSALITAIGMSLFLQNLARIIWGARTKRFPDEAIPAYLYQTAISLGDLKLSYLKIAIFLVTITIMLSLYLIVQRTKVGTAMRAISQDKTAASLMGINANRVISFTFALGSGMGGCAGIIVGMYYNAIYPTMGYIAGVKAFAAAVLGGIGNVPGAMLGGLLLGVGETFGAAYISSGYSHGIAYAIMILVIIFRPSGLLGRRSF